MNFKKNINSKDGFKYQWKVYRFFGADPFEKSNFLYWFYFIMINLMISVYYPLSMIINLFFINDFKTILENLSMSFPNVACSFKLFNFIIYRKELRKINPLLESIDKQIISNDDKEILQKQIKLSQKINLIHCFVYVLTLFVNSLSAYLSNYKKIVYPAWFPIDWTASKSNWYIIFFYQYIGVTIQALENACNDTYPVSYLMILTTHIHLLKKRIERITKDSDKSLDENYAELIQRIDEYNTLMR